MELFESDSELEVMGRIKERGMYLINAYMASLLSASYDLSQRKIPSVITGIPRQSEELEQ